MLQKSMLLIKIKNIDYVWIITIIETIIIDKNFIIS